jgi:hypothetical protein
LNITTKGREIDRDQAYCDLRPQDGQIKSGNGAFDQRRPMTIASAERDAAAEVRRFIWRRKTP